MTDKLTGRLRTALVQAGYTDARNGNPSVRAMAEALGLNNSRVARYMYHGSNMQLDAREAIAEALNMSVAELDSEVEGKTVKTYSPPPAANLLNARERSLVNELIHVLADRHKEEGGEHADSSASITEDRESSESATKHPAGSAATDELHDRRRRRPGWDFEYEVQKEDQRAALDGGEVGIDQIEDDST